MSDRVSWNRSIISYCQLFEIAPMGAVLGAIRRASMAIFLAFVGFMVPGAPAYATEFLVNTITTGEQSNPSVATLTGGGFVIAWNDLSGTAPDTSFTAVRAQRYNASGVAQGSEFLVNSRTASSQFEPSVAALNGGGFVIAFADNSQSTLDTTQTAILARIYNAAGVAQGNDFLINTSTANIQRHPSVAVLTNGDFVVSWTDGSAGNNDIRSRRYTASGTALDATDVLVNTTTTNSQVEPSIAPLSNGNYVIAWQDDNGDGSSSAIRARRFNASGTALDATDFIVNTTTTNIQFQPNVAGLSNGEFVIAWRDDSLAAPDTDSSAVRARRFNANGTALDATDFVVNTTKTSFQVEPSIASLPNGRFLIAWQDNSGDGSGIGVRAQRYNTAGAKHGAEFLVNTITTNSQYQPSAAALTNGNFIISWRDDSLTSPDTSVSAIRADIFTFNAAPTGSVAITGTATQHQTLSADASSVADDDGLGTFSYQWHRDSSAITGATASTYVLAQADVGSTFTVTVSYTDGGGTAESLTSTATASVSNANDLPTGSVLITGMTAQGQTLSADASAVADVDGLGVFTYQWRRNDFNIIGQNFIDYELTQADVGSTISVAVDYTDGGGKRESVVSSATAAIANTNDAPTGALTITGTAAQGQTLGVDTASMSDADGLGAFSYQWRADGSDISGVNGSSRILGQAEVGKIIDVVISYTDGFGRAESVISAATTAVTNTNDAPTGAVVITGSIVIGESLSADASAVADIDGLGTFSYQWRRNGTDISGASAKTYTLIESDVGQAIDVTASYTDGYGAQESVTSASTGTILSVGTTLFSSVLPSARSGYVGGVDITVFASVNNAGSNVAQNCQISIPAAAPVTLSYQETDANNAPMGAANLPFDLAVGQSRSFILSFMPTAISAGEDVFANFICDSANVDAITGVNTAFLTIEGQVGADILSVGSTPTGDGVINVPSGGTGFMTISATNIGTGDISGSADTAVTVSADTGSASMGLQVQFCETDASSVCITTLGSGPIDTVIGDTPSFFAIFIADQTGGAGIPLDPANARVFLRFSGANGTARSVTSAAIAVPTAAAEVPMASELPVGRWAVMVRETQGAHHAQKPGTLYVWPDGTAALHSGDKFITLNLSVTGAGTFAGHEDQGVLAGQYIPDHSLFMVDIRKGLRLDIWGVHDTRGLGQE